MNMKIWHKVIVAPAVAMAFLLLLGLASYLALSRQQGALDDLRESDFVAYRTAAAGASDVTDVHSGVYRLFTWMGNMDDKKIAATRAGLKTKLEEVQKGLKKIEALPKTSDEERKVLGKLSEHVAKYGKQVDAAIDLATVDVNTGMAAMQTADFTYQELRKEFVNQVAAVQVSAEENFATAQATGRNATLVSLAILVFALLGSALAAFLVARQIARPLNDAVLVAEALAKGDLTQKVEVRSKDEVGQLMAAMKGTLEQLGGIIHGIKVSTAMMDTASHEIASGNEDLSQRTEEQASSLEETASSMEELTSTVMQNAENAKKANHLAAGASEVAVKGGSVIGEVVSTMSSINESSKKIVDIISVIDGIAFQTNILALNAAVEAARAGEQGRGFAVVAAEVRTLAQRSAAAAKEIKQLIGDSVHTVESGTKLVDEAGKTMDQIVSSVKQVTDIMAEIAAASQQQSSGIEEVNQAITQMDQVTQQNAALVEEAAAAADSLKQQAQHLVHAVAVFKLAEAEQEAKVAVGEVQAQAVKPRAVPARRVEPQTLPKERRLRVAAEPRRAFAAAHASAAGEKGGGDQWTEL
jgi:methyl-accepting chemotaxis protein